MRTLVVLSWLLMFGMPPLASAATLCVTTAAKSDCPALQTFTTIGAALLASSANDVIQVAKGTYAEDAIIGKSLSIVGANPKNTIIDASGKANGFFVDGISVPGLKNVAISGFTVKNAKFEGILVANASAITVSDNIVSNNNQARVPPPPGAESGTCPGIPAFETAEDDDCGEGLHLLGADHSIVANNVVQNNAGGILISDDTAQAGHNLITGNTVQKNSFDCGITMASHPPAGISGSDTPLGVIQNTVSNNLSTQNGLATSDGAGVGIFDGAAGGIASGNIVVGNTLTRNGLPGVTMHSHSAGQNLSNNQIVDNTISGNAADGGDAATPGTTGIDVFGVSPATGTIISGNTISGEDIDVVVNTPVNVAVHFNNLLGKNTFGVQTANGTADATQNFWGCPKGPPAQGCSQIVPGTGITVLPVAGKKF